MDTVRSESESGAGVSPTQLPFVWPGRPHHNLLWPGRPYHFHGFTILEIVIASAIAFFVFGMGFLAITTTVAASNEASLRIRETENARLFFNMLLRDLATGCPGPGNIVKNPREIIPQGSATYVQNCITNPSPFVLTVKGLGTPDNPDCDMLQFYCHSEDPSARDEYMFVRYYVNRSDNSVCRQATVYFPPNPPLIPPATDSNLPDYVNPTNFTNNAGSDFALFDSVHSLNFVYLHWNTVTKQYEREGLSYPSGSGLITPNICDALLITVIFSDQYKQARVDEYAGNNKTTSNNLYMTNVNQTYRSYTKIIPIPATFKQ